jgi:hypothetical protein
VQQLTKTDRIMKKIIVAILFFTVRLSYSQECKLSFDQLMSVASYNLNELDTFSIKNGFSYNSHEQYYLCDTKRNGKQNFLMRKEKDGVTGIVYSFYDKQDYIAFKEILEKKDFNKTQKQDEKSLILQYFYNGTSIGISTSTYDDGSNTYMISIAIPK